jgi:DNA-binding NarL/FixJ family response regulator
VIRARYFETMTSEQVGDELRLASSTVRNHAKAALGKLERDDELYDVLVTIGKVRRYAREIDLQRAA